MLQICCDNKNSKFNKTTKNKPNTLWNKVAFYNNEQIKTRELPKSISAGILTEHLWIQARINIEEKAKEQVQRTEMLELKCHKSI